MTHNVFFWLKDGADYSKFEEEAKNLLEVDAVRSGSIGKLAPTPKRPVTDKTFNYHLSLKFDSVDAHNTYQNHPTHHLFVSECKELWERVIVYDTEFI